MHKDHAEGLSRRQFLRTSIGAGVGFAIVACAPGVAPVAPSGSAGASEAAQVITDIGPYIARTDVAGVVDFPNCWGGVRIEYMEQQIANFASHYPNITVNSSVSLCGELERQHMTSIAAGTPPNAIMLRSDAIPFFVQEGALMSLDDLVARDELAVDDLYYKGEIDTRRWDGQLWGMPNATGGNRHMLWWNKDLFEEAGLDPETPPTTWQELDEMADVVGANLPGRFLLEHNHTSGGHPPLMVWSMCNNGSYISEDLRTITFNSPEGVETLEWMVQFAKRQAGSYDRMAATEAERQNSLEGSTWAKGIYLTATAGAWYFAQLASAAPDMRYGAALLPYNAANPDARSATPSYAGWSFCIPTGASDVDAAWEWIKYSCFGRGQREFFSIQCQPSPVASFNQEPDFCVNDLWDVVIRNLETTVPVMVTPVMPQIRDIMYDLTDEALFEQKTPQQALDDGAAAAQALLDNWWASVG